MPLSGAERIRLYREKLKKNPESHQRYLQQDAERKREARLRRTEEQKAEDQAGTNERVEKFRKRKALDANESDVPKKTLRPNGPAILRAYASARTLGKAVTRVKRNLPQSPRKAFEVMNHLAASYGIAEPKSRFGQPQSDKLELHSAVKEFYTRDDISRQSPGRKDFIIIRDGNKKELVQKRHLLMTVQEAHALFTEEFEGKLDIGKSKFAELRPKHVLPMSEMPENVCLCQHHENPNYVLASLKSVVSVPFPGDHRSLISSLGCSQNLECMSPGCKQCAMKLDELVTSVPQEDLCKPLVFKQWGKTAEGHPIRETHTKTVKEGLEKLKQQSANLLLHCYVKKEQSEYFQKLMQSATPNHILLQIDFSENYSIHHQDAVQADHWAGIPVSVYTAVAWTGQDVPATSIAIVSDSMQHDKYAVAAFNKVIFDLILPTNSDQTTHVVEIFSDGAAQHFKQRYTLSHASCEKRATINWNFFATSHGKGAVDGVGGTIKRAVHRSIMANQVEPKDAQEFAECAKKRVPGVKTFYVSTEEINLMKADLDLEWQDVKTLPGLQGVHCLRTTGPHCMRYSTVSSDVEGQIFNFSSKTHSSSCKDNVTSGCASRDSMTPVEELSIRDAEQHKTNFSGAITDFENYVSTLNFRIKGNTPADGNCFFWCVSDQIDANGLPSYTHQDLRKMTVASMKSLQPAEKVHFKNFITQPIGKYLTNLKKNGTYADHLCAEYLAKHLELSLLIVIKDQPNVTLGADSAKSKLVLGYLPQIQHYVSLVPKYMPEEIKKEHYYAVYYTDPACFAIGKVTSDNCTCNSLNNEHIQLKFLTADYITGRYDWPKTRKDTLQCASKTFIFHGPVHLNGSGPFTVEDLREIKTKFANIKKNL